MPNRRLVLTEIQRLKNVKIIKEMHGHPDAVFGQRPDGHTYLCHTFDLNGAGRKESSGTGLGSRQNQKNISLITIIIDLIERLFFDKKKLVCDFNELYVGDTTMLAVSLAALLTA